MKITKIHSWAISSVIDVTCTHVGLTTCEISLVRESVCTSFNYFVLCNTCDCVGVFIPQAPVCDSGLSGQVLSLHEDWGGCAPQQHRLQAQRSCFTWDEDSSRPGVHSKACGQHFFVVHPLAELSHAFLTIYYYNNKQGSGRDWTLDVRLKITLDVVDGKTRTWKNALAFSFM